MAKKTTSKKTAATSETPVAVPAPAYAGNPAQEGIETAKNEGATGTPGTTPPAGQAAPPVEPAPAQPKALRAMKTDGIVYRVKMLTLATPSITDDELIAALKSEGFKNPSPSTVSAFRSDFVHSLRLLKTQGYDVPA